LGGFNDNYESVTIFLNAIKIENSELYIWYDNLLINFVKKYRNTIVDKNNVFFIKLKTDDQLSYITQIKLELKK
jgi:endo-beta-N-acetylglucosaminidase D